VTVSLTARARGLRRGRRVGESRGRPGRGVRE